MNNKHSADLHYLWWLALASIASLLIYLLSPLLVFGELFGFVGLLLTLPASAILLVWLRQVRKQYLKSNLYNS
jgi:predicted PurR-regulated permease PerM